MNAPPNIDPIAAHFDDVERWLTNDTRGERFLDNIFAELCIRLQQRFPGDLLYEPSARVRHLVPGDRLTLRYFSRRCWHEGRSKALVSSSVGAAYGLATERGYVTRTLPRAMVESTRRGARGLPRLLVIPFGVAVTALGYVAGRATMRAPGKEPWCASRW